MQQCWLFPRGGERISCVKRQLNLGVIPEEKQRCQALAPGERGSCVSQLERRVHDLVKFRLYDLEETAEELLEEGRLSQDDAIAFITAMERRKSAYNAAGTIAEKKGIVLGARQEWLALLRKVTS